MILIKEKNKISMILIILLFLAVISIIWSCFILGEIEHNDISKDNVDVFYKEQEKKDDVIDNGEIIIFEKKDEKVDTVVEQATEVNNYNQVTNKVSRKNSKNNIAKNTISQSNSNNIVDNKSDITQNTTNEVIEDNKKPEEPNNTESGKEPLNPEEPKVPEEPEEKPDKPQEPSKPEDPEDPDEPEKPEEPDPPKPPEIDRTGTYWVEDKDIVWEDKCKLGIFKNPRYNMRTLIAPGSTSSYVFYVSNKMGFDLNYIINFSEENDINVNMMYKLRREDEYIAGDENTWVYYDSLHIDYEIENEGKDKYILEWKWVDSDNDTEIGINHAGDVYKLNINICATQISGLDEENPSEDESNNEENPGEDESNNEENPSEGDSNNEENPSEGESNNEENLN